MKLVRSRDSRRSRRPPSRGRRRWTACRHLAWSACSPTGYWWGMPWLALELLDGRTLLDELEDLVVGRAVGIAVEPRRSPRGRAPPGRQRPAPRLPAAPARRFAAGRQRRIAAAGRLGEVAALVSELADTPRLRPSGRTRPPRREARERLLAPPAGPGPRDPARFWPGLSAQRPSPCRRKAEPVRRHHAIRRARANPRRARRRPRRHLLARVCPLRAGDRRASFRGGHRARGRPKAPLLARPTHLHLVLGPPPAARECRFVEMLAKQPDNRPGSAREVAERLGRISNRAGDEMESTNLVGCRPL